MYLLAGMCTNPDFLSGTVLPMVGTSVSLMVFLLALFWMAAQLFHKPEYESFVSIETYQLMVSVIVLVIIFSFACFSSQLSDSFAGGDTFEIARNYLNHMSNEVALKTVLALEAGKLFTQYWGSLTFRWGLTVWGLVVPGFPSMILIERVIEFLLLLVLPFVASLVVQAVGLEIIRGTMLPFVLPAGAVLRIFPPTRDAGTFLMATAIGFQIIFPYTYVMHSAIVTSMMEKDSGSVDSMEKLLSSTGYGGLMEWNTDFGIFDSGALLFSPLRAMSYLLLQALFLPSLSMILTVAFIKGFAKFMSQKMG